MKTLTTATMLLLFGAVIGMNESQLCFPVILAGIITALYGIRKEVAR